MKTRSDLNEEAERINNDLLQLYKECPVPEEDLLSNLSLFISKSNFSRMLYVNDLYKRILGTHGVIMEFGVFWGQNTALIETLRGIYEPFNSNRKIIGFDTFKGFENVHSKDGTSEFTAKGNYSTTANYEKYLKKLINLKMREGYDLGAQTFEIRKGDAGTELRKYLEHHPETIIALAYFDMDLYEPTKTCLEIIKNHITKGTIIAFDELGVPEFPGETVALKEVFGLNKFRLIHSPFSSNRSFFVCE